VSESLSRSLVKIDPIWVPTVRSVTTSWVEIAAFRLALGDQGEQLTLAGGQPEQRIVAAGGSDQPADDDGWVERRPAAGHPADGVEEVVNPQHPGPSAGRRRSLRPPGPARRAGSRRAGAAARSAAPRARYAAVALHGRRRPHRGRHPGIRTSTTTSSGRGARTASSSAPASPTTATTWWPASASSRVIPSRRPPRPRPARSTSTAPRPATVRPASPAGPGRRFQRRTGRPPPRAGQQHAGTGEPREASGRRRVSRRTRPRRTDPPRTARLRWPGRRGRGTPARFGRSGSSQPAARRQS